MYDYIEPWEDTLASIAWSVITSYHRTLVSMPSQDLLGRYMVFNLTPIVDRSVVTARKQRQVSIDNVCKNSRQVRQNYAIGDLFSV